MKSYKASSGFSLLELLIVLIIVSVLTAASYPMFLEAKDDSRLQVSIKESKILLRYLNKVRTSTGGVTIAGTPSIYTHSVPVLSAGSSLSDLETLLGESTGLSSDNPWGNPYLLEISTHFVKVQTIVPGRVNPPQAQSSTASGSDTVIAFVSNNTASTSLIKAQSANIKRQLYSEVAR